MKLRAYGAKLGGGLRGIGQRSNVRLRAASGSHEQGHLV